MRVSWTYLDFFFLSKTTFGALIAIEPELLYLVAQVLPTTLLKHKLEDKIEINIQTKMNVS